MGILKKVMSEDGVATIAVIDATDVVQESLLRLSAFPPSMVHLGQAMMGAALTHSLWNDKGQVSKVALQWRVDGPFGHVFAESDECGHLRGTILKPQAPIDNYETHLGHGHLQVQKQVGTEVTGIIEAEGNVSNDLQEYLAQSEQRNSSLSLTVKVGWSDETKSAFQVDFAYGYLVDIIAQDEVEKSRSLLREWDQYLQSLGPISEWQLSSESPVDSMIRLLCSGRKANESLIQKISFFCNCSEERASRAAKLSEKLSDDDLSKDPLAVQCEFCGRTYNIKV